MRIRRAGDHLMRFQEADSLPAFFIGVTVLFASLGLGEVVYRLAFLDFDGTTDRLPIEALFGLILGKQTAASLHLIWNRNHRIRHAVAAFSPVAHPSKNQQSIRVIREEVEQIERALKDVLPASIEAEDIETF
jgi:hypothetical protein